MANLTQEQAIENALSTETEEETPQEAEVNEEVEEEEEIETENEELEETEEEDSNLYTVKVNGEEKQVPLDELIRGYGHQQAANKKFQEAANLRKQNEETIAEYEAFLGQLREKPLKVLQQIPELREVLRTEMQDYLREFVRQENMTEDEKRAYELEQELNQYKSKLQMTEQEREEAAREARVKEYTQNLSTWITSAVAEHGLTAPLQKRMLRNELSAVNASGQEITKEIVEEAAQFVARELKGYTPPSSEPKKTPPSPGKKQGVVKKKVQKSGRSETKAAEDFFRSLSDKYNLL